MSGLALAGSLYLAVHLLAGERGAPEAAVPLAAAAAVGGAAAATALLAQQARRSERRAAAAEAQARVSMQGSSRATWEYDTALRTLKLSEGWEALLGYPPGGLDGSPEAWLARVNPSALTRLAEQFDRLSSGDLTLCDSDVPYRHADGRNGILHITASAYGAAEARVIVGSYEEVTDRRREEQAQPSSRDPLSQLAASVPGVLCSLSVRADGQYQVQYASPRLPTLFGVTEDGTNGAPDILARVDSRDLPDLEDALQKSRDTGEPLRVEIRVDVPKRGSTWVELHASPEVQDGGGHVWHGYFQDVHDRRTVADALARSEQRLRAHLEHVPIGVVVLDAQGRFLDANPAAEAVTGRSSADLVGRRLSDLLHPADQPRLASGIRAATRSEPHLDVVRLLRPEGSYRDLRIRTALLRDGEYIGWVEDVSAERLSDTRLRIQVHLAQVARTADLAGLVEAGLDALARHVDSPVAWLWLRGEEQDELYLWSQTRPRETPARSDIAAEAERVAESRRPQVVGGTERRLALPESRPSGIVLVVGLAGKDTEYSSRDIALATSVIGSLADMVDAARAQSALRESEDNLTRAQAIAGMGSWTLDLRTDRLAWSRGLCLVLGLPPTQTPDFELLARTLYPGEPVRLEALWSEALTTGAFETEVPVAIGSDERWIRHRVELQRDEDGRILRATGTVQDVSARRRAQERLEVAFRSLRESEASLSVHRDQLERLVAERTAALESAEQWTRQILDSTHEGIVGLDLDGNVMVANPAACALLEISGDAIQGRSFRSLVHRPRGSAQAPSWDSLPIFATLHGGPACTIESGMFWLESGRELPVRYTVEPFGPPGPVSGAVVSFSDVTARLNSEAALLRARDEAQRLADTRSAFLANMSHEIRTPLNSVLGLAQIGRRDYPNSAAAETFAGIYDAGQLLLSLVNDILDYSKIEAGKLALDRQRFYLGEAIDRALGVTTIPAGKELGLRVEEADDLPDEIEGDSRRLSQVLVNLLSNAVKFTETWGQIVLRVRTSRSLDERGRRVESLIFEVSDTGIGMSEEQRLKLFRPFEQADHTTTRRFGGTGLGLSICRHLVEQMGGEIEARSAVGAGSTFRFTLPLTWSSPPLRFPRPTSITLWGLREDEAWFGASIEARGGVLRALEPESAEDPEILVVGSREILSSRVWGWTERIRRAGRQVMVISGAERSRWQDQGLPTLSRPLRARHVLRPPELRRAPPGRNRLPGLRVLGVEDNPANRLVLETFLVGEGARLVCMEDGLSAVDLLASQGPEAFDVVLTDISMPGIDGFETTRRMRKISPTLPIFALTAHALPGDRERCLAAGMDGCITKPVQIEALVEALMPYVRPDQPPGEAPAPRVNTLPPSPPSPASRSRSVTIDWQTLERTLPGGADLLERLTKVAVDTQGGTAGHLREAAAASDLAAIRRYSHDFVGVAGAFNLTSIVDQARLAEAAARTGSPEAATLACQLADVADELIQLLRARAQERAESKGP